MTRLRPMIACLLVAAVPGAGAAQGLSDPTKPPSTVQTPDAQSVISIGPQLQSVILSSRRKLAVIDGETVALGRKFGEFTLVDLTPSEAVLKRGEEKRILKLHPAIEKRAKTESRSNAPSEVKK